MKNIEIQTIEFPMTTSIICDICKTEHSDTMEIQEFINIFHICGYNSIFGDDNEIELDICQHCFKKLFEGKYRINENE